VARARREGWAVAVGLLVVLLAGAALEFSRDRQPAVAGGAATAHRSGASIVHDALGRLDAPVLADPGVPVPLRAGAPISLGDRGAPVAGAVTDDRVDSAVWAVRSADRTTTLRRLVPAPGPARRIPTTRRPEAVDVAAFSRRVGPAAVLVTPGARETLHVDVWRLSGRGRLPALVGRYDTAALARPAGSQRTVMAARWSGPRADLFVLDRAGPGGTMRIRVLSGETNFRSVVLSVDVARAGGFDRRRWSVDLQDVAGSGRADLIFTSRTAATGTGRIEVHVLAAQTNYSRYLLQVPTAHPAEAMTGHRGFAIRVKGQAQWLLVDVARGIAVPHPLIAAPPHPPRSP
jgi:hypothetical protein